MNVVKLQKLLEGSGAHLGDLVFWSLAEARVDRESLERIWREASLDASLLPDEPTAERALKLAARDAQCGRRDRLIRVGLDNEAEVVFAIVHEQRDERGNLRFQQEARIHLDRSTEQVTTDAGLHDIVQAMLASYQSHRATHPSDDVRKAIVKALASWRAVMLREGGGIYWVPNVHAPELRRLQTAIERIGSSRMYVLPVHQSPEADRTLGEIAAASLEAELAELQSEIAAFVSVPPERASTLVRRFDAFESLRSRAHLYRSVLSVQVLELDAAIDRMAGTVEQLLAQKQVAA